MSIKKVLFSIYTAGVGNICDILQVAVVDLEDEKSWTQYMQPTKSDNLKANEINESLSKEAGYGDVNYGIKVSPSEGMKRFITYLSENYVGGAILLAHNGYHVDFPQLKRYLDKYLPNYGATYTLQWIDSLKVFKKHFPGLKSYSKYALTERFTSSHLTESCDEAMATSGTPQVGLDEALLSCKNMKNIIKRASQEKKMTVAEFLGASSPLPFSFITSPYIEKKVLLDLETSTFASCKDSEILQIALVDFCDVRKRWTQYIQPKGRIDPKATEVNHLTVGINHKLCYRGLECDNVVAEAVAIKKFKTFLLTNYPEGATLIAHNGDRCDFPILKRYLQKYDEDYLKNHNERYSIACIDSLTVFQKHFRGLAKHNQDYLIKRFGGTNCVRDAHEALGDCINLKIIIDSAALEKKMTATQFLGELSNQRSIWSF